MRATAKDSRDDSLWRIYFNVSSIKALTLF